MQQIQQLQLNKCPHGLPQGACPICSNMSSGGVSKDKNKPRVPGEMSYNECMAEWIKIQARKEAKIQARINSIEMMKEKTLFNRMLLGLNKITKNINKILNEIILNTKNTIKPIINAFNNAIVFTKTIIVKIFNFTANFTNNLLTMASNALKNLAGMIDEVKNFIPYFMENFKKKIKKPFKMILSFFAESEEEDDDEKQKIKNLLKKLFRFKEEKDENITI